MVTLFVILVLAAFAIYIGRQFYLDHVIERYGRKANATVISSRQISANTGGSINGLFEIEFVNEHGQLEFIRFEETIAQLYAPCVQPGSKVNIKYLQGRKRIRVSFCFNSP